MLLGPVVEAKFVTGRVEEKEPDKTFCEVELPDNTGSDPVLAI